MRFRVRPPPLSIAVMKPPKHIPGPFWRGVRLRTTPAAAEPEVPPRLVTLPAAWEDAAAAALAALVPGSFPVVLEQAADGWIGRLDGGADLAPMLHGLLRDRRGAASAAVWQGAADGPPRFVLNLPAFYSSRDGFDYDGFAAAVDLAVRTLTAHDPAAARLGVGMADLAGLLAAIGLDYDSAAGRDVAACVAALLRAAAEAASAVLAERLGRRATAAPPPASPASCVLPGLAAAAHAAQRHAASLPGRRHLALTALAAPDAAEALLGVESGGIAPGFSPLDDTGRLTRAAAALLAARGLSAEAALAATLAGHTPFATIGPAAHAAMQQAVAPYFDALPALPAALPAPAPKRRELPARHAGLAQTASVGGHRVHLRTGEYADGTLGSIAIGLPKEGATVRGLMDAFAQSVSLGLQHGVALEELVDAFTLTRFGPAGAVEGDPQVARATSLLDYVFRTLAAHYLGRTDLPEAEADDAALPAPSLPLDLPQARRGLRLVK